jgi:hypothetical protein
VLMSRSMSRPRKPKEPPSSEKILAAIEERRRIIQSWNLGPDDLVNIIAENPHVYSPTVGFLAEYNCRKFHLASQDEVTDIRRPGGYDKKDKGDFCFVYKQEPIRLEVKSLDGPKVVSLNEGVCEVVWCSVEKVPLANHSLRVIVNSFKKFNVFGHYRCYKILEKCPSTKQLRKLGIIRHGSPSCQPKRRAGRSLAPRPRGL